VSSLFHERSLLDSQLSHFASENYIQKGHLYNLSMFSRAMSLFYAYETQMSKINWLKCEKVEESRYVDVLKYYYVNKNSLISV
jgi:hypothetical protein